MSVVITGTPELTEIVAPSNTELGDANTLRTGVVQPIANRLAYDRDQIDDLRDRVVGVSSTTRYFDVTRGHTWSNHWQVRQFSQNSVHMLQQMVIGSEPWVVRITDMIPPSGEIVGFGVQYKPIQSTPPDTAPGTVLRIGLGIDPNLEFGTAPDSMETFYYYDDNAGSNFRARHQVARTLPTPYTIDPTREYCFFIWGESGAYAMTNGQIERAYLVIE
jgi:hypothetical protein